MNRTCQTDRSRNRAGIVLFVVLGAIFILSILIMSYNHLVRGKFNESRELLKHQIGRASCRERVCYVV